VSALGPWPVLLRVGFAGSIAYRAEMVIWFLTTTMPLVMLALWSAAAADAPIEGFGQPEFVTYYAAALVVRHLSSSWVVWELNADVRSGALSMYMLRPIHPIWVYVAENLGATPLRLVVLVPIIGVLCAVLPAAPVTSDPVHLLLCAWTLLCAWVLMFSAQTIVGLLSLWTGQSLAIWDAFFGLFALLSGYLVPLELFPASVRPVADALPFHAMGGLSIEILMGHLDTAAILRGVAIQGAWMVAFVLGARAVWGRGVRRFGAFGG
jgi:ABC-2 type transport system permease protein